MWTTQGQGYIGQGRRKGSGDHSVIPQCHPKVKKT